jgi:Domain of unknown function (DUF4397)
MSWKRSLTIPIALSAALVAWMAGTAPAAAADTQAHVRFVYVAADGPSNGGDLYVDGRRVVSGARYKEYTNYFAVTTAQHTFQLRWNGTTQGVADITQALAAGSYSTVFLGTKASDMHAVLFSDNISTPPAGKALARFVHMAYQVPGVNVTLDDNTVLFSNIGFLEGSQYISVAPGTYHLNLRQASNPDQNLFNTNATVSAAGAVYTMVGIGGIAPNVVALLALGDAASAGVAPIGGATTGAGGLAFGQDLRIGLIAFALVGTACLLLLARRSQPA